MPYLTVQREIELITLYQNNNDQSALRELVQIYRGRIASIAASYCRNRPDLIDDGISYGYEGLLVAINKYRSNHAQILNEACSGNGEHRQATPFTYFVYSIRVYMRNGLRRITQHIGMQPNTTSPIARYLRDTFQENGCCIASQGNFSHTVTPERIALIAKLCNTTEKRVTDVYNAILPSPHYTDSEQQLAFVEAQASDMSIVDTIDDKILIEEYRSIFHQAFRHAGLTDRERTVLRLRYLETDEDHSTASIARQINRTRERTRQLECRAIAKLQKHIQKHHLKKAA